MPVYIPLVINNTVPPVQVTGAGNVSYEQILNSLGDFNFLVEQIFLSAISIDQIRQNVGFQKYDATGNQDNQIIASDPDPYQRIPSIYLDTKGRKVVLDGRSNMYFTVLAGEIMTFVLFCDQVDVRQQLEKFSKINAIQNEIKN